MQIKRDSARKSLKTKANTLMAPYVLAVVVKYQELWRVHNPCSREACLRRQDAHPRNNRSSLHVGRCGLVERALDEEARILVLLSIC